MSFKKTLLILNLLITGSLACQTVGVKLPTEIKAIPDKVNGRLDIEFKNDKQVDNLLVLVTDSAGQTVFLENLYRYKGLYKKNIELPYGGRGFVTLHINKDEERIIRKLSLK